MMASVQEPPPSPPQTPYPQIAQELPVLKQEVAENRSVKKEEPKLGNDNIEQSSPLNGHKNDLFQPAAATDLPMETDRTLYSMPMPENVDAMTDLIKLHKKGDYFPYVGVVGTEGESLDATRARLLAMKPQYNANHLPEFSVEACPLISTRGEFTMSKLLEFAKATTPEVSSAKGLMPTVRGPQQFQIKKNYAQIKSIKIIYTPNMSSTADYCKFWVTLSDNRMVNNTKSGPKVAMVSNQEGVVEMGCDYCVSTRDIGSYVLSYLLERAIMKADHQWGTMTLVFTIVESDIPFQAVKRDTMAVYRMPVSTLAERETDPDTVDISFTSADIKALRELFMSGDVVDVDAPQNARLKKSSYSKSTLRGGPKGEALAGAFDKAEGWGFMKGARKPKVDAMNASISVPDEDDPEDIDPEGLQQSKEAWAKEQERLRAELEQDEKSEDLSPPTIQPPNDLSKLFSSQLLAGKGVRFQEDAV
jgi:hypothetical protein